MTPQQNEKFRSAYEAVREILFSEPFDVKEADVLSDALGILYGRLPEAQ